MIFVKSIGLFMQMNAMRFYDYSESAAGKATILADILTLKVFQDAPLIIFAILFSNTTNMHIFWCIFEGGI